jgi:hypothetical protein
MRILFVIAGNCFPLQREQVSDGMNASVLKQNAGVTIAALS